MALYALGDLHLSYQSKIKSVAQRESALWQGHEERFLENCRAMVTDADTLLLLGDHSWGKKLPYCQKDLEYIESLPGRKILLRGNHDHFWDVKKTEQLNQMYEGRLHFLQNNYFLYKDYALVGTKGYCFEGPFYMSPGGQIVGYDEEAYAHAQALVEREAGRLQKSFDAAVRDGHRRFIMLLHYPPTSLMERDSIFTKMAEQYHVEQVIYAHCHGEARFHDSIRGRKKGILYSLASGDCLRWKPLKVLS